MCSWTQQSISYSNKHSETLIQSLAFNLSFIVREICFFFEGILECLFHIYSCWGLSLIWIYCSNWLCIFISQWKHATFCTIHKHKFSTTQVLSWHSMLTLHIFYLWDKGNERQLEKYKHTYFNLIWTTASWLFHTGIFLYLKSNHLDRCGYQDFDIFCSILISKDA